MNSSRLAAQSIIGIGLLHCLLFLWFGRRVLRSVVNEGLWNTIDPIRDRQMVFWALLAGVVVILLGQLSWWLSKRGQTLPAFLGWQLLGITLACGVLMPISGAWLFLVPAALIIAGARPSR